MKMTELAKLLLADSSADNVIVNYLDQTYQDLCSTEYEVLTVIDEHKNAMENVFNFFIYLSKITNDGVYMVAANEADRNPQFKADFIRLVDLAGENPEELTKEIERLKNNNQ